MNMTPVEAILQLAENDKLALTVLTTIANNHPTPMAVFAAMDAKQMYGRDISKWFGKTIVTTTQELINDANSTN